MRRARSARLSSAEHDHEHPLEEFRSVMARIKQPGSEEAKRFVQQKSYHLFATSYEPNICLVMKKSMIFPITPDKAYAKPSIIIG